MDFHKFDGITIEDVKTAHIADLTVQDKYGVKYHQFWVNELAGTVFCLMEGPDKETCEAVHREAHGEVACALVEVEPGYYELFMGKNHVLDNGFVLNEDGSADLGYRNVMVVAFPGIFPFSDSGNKKFMRSPHSARKLVVQKINEFNGSRIEWQADDSIVSVFSTSVNAVRCAYDIQHALEKQNDPHSPDSYRDRDQLAESKIVFRIGVGTGQPVTENNDFFGEAIKLAFRLSNLAHDNHILLSSLTKELCANEEISGTFKERSIQTINPNDENFITNLFSITENKLADEHFTIESLSRDIGISRPQLYRKIVTLTGKSPNDLVRDMRMNKAVTLLKKNSLNIAQVALEVGYNNPSYFTKCFAEKFGCTPSEFVEGSVV